MKKGNIGSLIWLAIVCLFLNGGLVERLFSSASNNVEYDYNMNTTNYAVDVNITEEGSYQVTERIDVDFLKRRHGIYRYIPIMGTSIFFDEMGELQKLPYRGKITDVKANVPVDVSRENGNEVLRMGDADTYQYGETGYVLSYTFTPYFQESGYTNAYYNIFPLQWQNDIPVGSSFSITFPREFDSSVLQFYYGEYGENYTASYGMLDLTKDGRVVSGVLRDTLNFGQGLTMYGNMGADYFAVSNTVPNINIPIIGIALAILAIIVFLFLRFGKDKKIIPSIQYQPPEGMDSGAVGYIVDGVIENRDVISLIIYWADKGCLDIEETSETNLIFHKKKELPVDATAYEKTMFQELFSGGNDVELKSLKYKFTDTIEAVKAGIQMEYSGQKRLYSNTSRVARGISVVLCGIPFLVFMAWNGIYSYNGMLRNILQIALALLFYVGLGVLCRGIDTWHGKSAAARRSMVMAGVGVSFTALAFYSGSYVMRVWTGESFNFIPGLIVTAAVTCIMAVFTGFMRKRTDQCVEWMGRLVGLRDFIETAELDRMKVLAQEDPQWFYHIIPYAYVFGISDVFASKLEGLELPPPVWYRSNQRMPGYFNYYVFHRMFMGNMYQVSKVMTTPRPPAPSSVSSGGDGFGGGFSGGGGGGFSGGGFGGGGGGSW